MENIKFFVGIFSIVMLWMLGTAMLVAFSTWLIVPAEAGGHDLLWILAYAPVGILVTLLPLMWSGNEEWDWAETGWSLLTKLVVGRKNTWLDR